MLKNCHTKVLEQALGEMFGSVRAPTALKTEMLGLVHTKSFADTVVQSVLFTMVITALIAQVVGKLLDRAVEKHPYQDIERACTTNISLRLSTQRAQSGATRPSKISSDFKSRKNSRCSRRHCLSSSNHNYRKKSIWNGHYSVSGNWSEKFSESRTSPSRQ